MIASSYEWNTGGVNTMQSRCGRSEYADIKWSRQCNEHHSCQAKCDKEYNIFCCWDFNFIWEHGGGLLYVFLAFHVKHAPVIRQLTRKTSHHYYDRALSTFLIHSQVYTTFKLITVRFLSGGFFWNDTQFDRLTMSN